MFIQRDFDAGSPEKSYCFFSVYPSDVKLPCDLPITLSKRCVPSIFLT